MRYSDLLESDDQIRIDAALFRVDEDDQKFVSFVKAETEDKDDTKMWAVCGIRREAGAAIVIGLVPAGKKVQAHLVRTQAKGRPGWRLEPVKNLQEIMEYVKASGYGMLARHLMDLGVTLLD
jgi:hypothetical protein